MAEPSTRHSSLVRREIAAVWLFAAVAQIFVAMTVEHVFTTAWVASDAALILIYFALTWQAGRMARG